ncbi:MAG: molybdopterin-guanine dinucleotide biosynthesis protein MobB [Burkholderiales bacterium]|nr:molybdopterin-guanine dinucleotide biosynthesis protein MobB [Burkholderiales bacterium]
MAGAQEVLVSSANRFALMHELRDEPEWSLRQLLGKLAPVDLVLIEGFKREGHPKIEIFRSANGKPPLHPGDPHIKAIACDVPFPGIDLPQAHIDDIPAIADLSVQLAIPLAAFLEA